MVDDNGEALNTYPISLDVVPVESGDFPVFISFPMCYMLGKNPTEQDINDIC